MLGLTPTSATKLADRAVIRLTHADGEGGEVADFLQGLVTSDVTGPLPKWAGLLTPQGKALFDFIVWRDGADLLLDCEAQVADALIRRLSLYRLRRAIIIARDPALAVHWSADAIDGAISDPRLATLGWRRLAPADAADGILGQGHADAAWQAHRLACGVAEGRAELGDGEVLWLECNAVDLAGVSFTKGCYIGQENTARMNWRAKVARRLVVVPLARSNPARRRAAFPALGLAVDHLRVDDIDPALIPAWMHVGSASDE